MTDLLSAYRMTAPTEVRFNATVTSASSEFNGTHGRHEQFGVDTSAGPIQIVDNIDIAPRVPVQPGDNIQVCGEMVHDPGKMPIVHWTHHDPSRHHADGFIRLNGRLYA